jgi:hypothetical protein
MDHLTSFTVLWTVCRGQRSFQIDYFMSLTEAQKLSQSGALWP